MPIESPQNLIAKVRWNEKGLAPAIVQDHRSKDVLMLAWVSKESLQLSLREQVPVYWSRSRQKLWRKGETSGNTQKLFAARLDCDYDALLFLIEQTGPACHTGQPNCFFHTLLNNKNED